MTVGSSPEISPPKHLMLRELAFSEVTSAREVAASIRERTGQPCMYGGHLFVDLTAGDAAGDGANSWWRGSSPAIFSYIAAKHRMVRLRLYEIEQATFRVLISKLALRLPQVGFIQYAESSWIHQETVSTVDAYCGDARILEDFSDLRPFEWLFVNNDPNSIHGWAINMDHLANAVAHMRGQVCAVSTIGSNAGGKLKTLPIMYREPIWRRAIECSLDLLASQQRFDLVLRKSRNSSQQWAYLLLVPQRKSLPVSQGTFDYSWRRNPGAFERAINELLYSKMQMSVGHAWRMPRTAQA